MVGLLVGLLAAALGVLLLVLVRTYRASPDAWAVRRSRAILGACLVPAFALILGGWWMQLPLAQSAGLGILMVAILFHAAARAQRGELSDDP